MKRILKRIAVCSLAFLTCFAFVGCGKSDPDKNGKPESEPKINQEQQFSNMKSAVARVDSVEDFSDGWTIEETDISSNSFIVDEAGFNPTGETWTEETKKVFLETTKNNFKSGTEERKTVFAFNKGANTGYKVRLEKEGTTEKIQNFEIVENADGSYKIYRVDQSSGEIGYDKMVFNADANYTKNYGTELLEKLKDLIEYFDHETFAEFKTAMENMFGSQMEELGAVPTTSLEFTENEGVTTMSFTLTIVCDLVDMDGVQLTNVDATLAFVVDFNEDGIVSFSENTSTRGMMVVPVDATNTINIQMNSTSNVQTKIKKSYDGTKCPQLTDDFDKGSFVDKGNVVSEVNFIVNGMLIESINKRYGTVFSGGYEGYEYSTYFEGVEWFLDAECTQKFEGAYPSNDINLYANLTLPEGKVFAYEIYVSNYSSIAENLEKYVKGSRVKIVDAEYACTNGDSGVYSKIYINGVEKSFGETVSLNITGVNFIVYVY